MQLAILIGLVAFGLVNLWKVQDLFNRPRNWIENRLAIKGWQTQVGQIMVQEGEPSPRPGVAGALARFLWGVLSCPYCLGVYVSFLATWYSLGWGWHTLWSHAFWLAWWAAWAVHTLCSRLWIRWDDESDPG